MQIKLPNEKQAERKLPDLGILPNLYFNELCAGMQKNIMLEMQKPTQHHWQEYIIAYSTERVNLKCKLELH